MQFPSKLFAYDQIRIKVVGINEVRQSINNLVFQIQRVAALFNEMLVYHVEYSPHAVEEKVNKWSDDQHDGRHGGVRRGWLVMLESETAGGVAGRSTTNFVDDNHVSNKN